MSVAMTTPSIAFYSAATIATMALVVLSVVARANITKPDSPDFLFPVDPRRKTTKPLDPLTYVIVEELPVMTPVGSVPVDAMFDRVYTKDQLRNFQYAVGSQATSDRSKKVELFSVDGTSGIIRTATRIDREFVCFERVTCSVMLDVIVTPAEYFRIVKVSIEITDVNDNSPEFILDELQLRISESALTGSSYALPVAVDDDGEQFGVQRYQLIAEPSSNAVNIKAVERVNPFNLLFNAR